MKEAHVVCRACGARFLSVKQPRYCVNPACDAGWLDLPCFEDKADAERAAKEFEAERAPA